MTSQPTQSTAQVLTTKGIVDSVYTALEDGTLLALHPEAAMNESGIIVCAYEVGDYHCAIGVGLNRASLDKINKDRLNDKLIGELIRLNIVSCSHPDIGYLKDLQIAHDNWLTETTDTEDKHQNFIRLLNQSEDLFG
jgi:hypothetical protein